jgi:malonate decarboxylase epsilon subunit
MSVAFIFPGQGSQFPGMLHQLLDHPAVVRTLDEISEDLHSDVRTVDTERGLEFTVDVQIALLAAGVATARALMEQDIEPAAVSGLSVGAFAAAVTAGVLSLRDAVELVRLRAERMMKLYPSGYGLSAIVGLNETQVTKIVQAVTSVQDPVETSTRHARSSLPARTWQWIKYWRKLGARGPTRQCACMFLFRRIALYSSLLRICWESECPP